MATLTETRIANMALAKIGAKQIASGYTIDTDTTPDGLQAALIYDQTRDALLRSFVWRFATGRAMLQMDSVVPSFGWEAQFILPQDFLRMISVYIGEVESPSQIDETLYAIEGNRLLADEETFGIRYIKRIEDVTLFDPLFVQVLILQLALQLLSALAGIDTVQLKNSLELELNRVLTSARLVSLSESNVQSRRNHSMMYFKTMNTIQQ